MAQKKVSRSSKTKNAGGRPSKFDPEWCVQAEKLCKLGAKDTEIADFFEVGEATLNRWKTAHPEFAKALKRGKMIADAEVAHSLYHRALGYSHPEVHISNYQGEITQTPIIKHYAPDTTACIYWLKNRQPELWRDRQELTGKDGTPLIPVDVDDDMEIARRVAFMLTAATIEKAAKSAKEPTA